MREPANTTTVESIDPPATLAFLTSSSFASRPGHSDFRANLSTNEEFNLVKQVRRIGVGAMLILFFAAALSAQETTATLRGTVSDSSGARVPSASITAVQAETGFTRVGVTDSNGDYLLVLLPIGHYRLEVVAKGFRTYVQEGLDLSVNQVAQVQVRLVVGMAQQTVQVKADAGLVSTTSDLGETINDSETVDLPLNGRNFSQLGLLMPGTAPLTQGLQIAGGSTRQGQSYAVNGMRPESNEFLVDGAENYNSINAGFVLKPPPDASAEFRILTNTASAEFGHNAGSNTNIVMRSGSNKIHGDVYDFLRNDAVDARNFFSVNTEPLKQNQFGGTLGGPIRKDKTFLFGFYEGFRNRQGETQLTTVPTALERQGNFSQAPDVIPCQTGIPQAPPGQLQNCFTGETYSGNTLPSINPISQNILAFYPLPNLPNYGPNSYGTTQEVQNTSDQFGLRLDHYISSRDTFSFHYLFSNGSQVDPLSISGANVPGFPVGEDFRAQNAAFEETHSFSGSLINVARFSFLRNKFLFGLATNHTPPSALGFEYQPTLPIEAGPPFIEISGLRVGRQSPSPDLRTTIRILFSFTDSGGLEFIGKHEFKFGGEIQRDQLNTLLGIASNGFFVFPPVVYNETLAAFESGQPVVFLQGGGDLPRGMSALNYNFYAQESYKASHHLTINAGTHGTELPHPYNEIHNKDALFIPGFQSTVEPTASLGLAFPGDRGVPSTLSPTEHNAFAPRLGLAWDPTGSGKWAVRAAYGVFFEPYYNGEGVGRFKLPKALLPWFKTIQSGTPGFATPRPALPILCHLDLIRLHQVSVDRKG